ncbi:unnamed protein product [Rotaria sordida]|uniref:Uncharacterized protein n=1 Tax=Rotaria sordida TaxID=392033 RepID=A0A820ETR2_9BILA|nr:unnamed protein product [Rotaria sordida]
MTNVLKPFDIDEENERTRHLPRLRQPLNQSQQINLLINNQQQQQ